MATGWATVQGEVVPRIRLGLLAGAMVVAGACSSGGESTAETLAPPTSDSTTTSSSTTSTTLTTTTGSTSTTAPIDPVEAAVRDVHTRVMTQLFARDEFKDDPEVRIELARELTIDPQLTRIEDGIRGRSGASERVVSPGYDSNIIDVSVDGEMATVRDCSRDRGALVDADGEVVVPEDDYFKIRTTQLRLVDGEWFVEEIFSGGDERCEPDV